MNANCEQFAVAIEEEDGRGEVKVKVDIGSASSSDLEVGHIIDIRHVFRSLLFLWLSSLSLVSSCISYAHVAHLQSMGPLEVSCTRQQGS